MAEVPLDALNLVFYRILQVLQFTLKFPESVLRLFGQLVYGILQDVLHVGLDGFDKLGQTVVSTANIRTPSLGKCLTYNSDAFSCV